MDIKQLEKLSKALGDVHRLKILQDMAVHGGSLQCAQIVNVTALAQPSVSHHIKILIEAGLIAPEKEGRHYTYTLNEDVLTEYVKQIAAFGSVSINVL